MSVAVETHAPAAPTSLASSKRRTPRRRALELRLVLAAGLLISTLGSAITFACVGQLVVGTVGTLANAALVGGGVSAPAKVL